MYSEQPYPEMPLAPESQHRLVPLPRDILPENGQLYLTGAHGFAGSSILGHLSPSPAASGYASFHLNAVEILKPGHPYFLGPAYVSPTASGFISQNNMDAFFL